LSNPKKALFVSNRVGMKRGPGIVFSVFALTVALGVSTYAHHGNSAYDENKPITLKGVVTEFDWVNPHAQIYFDVTGPKGHVAHWGCETLSPGKLTRAGWTKDSVKAGDQITITLVAAKTGAPVGFLQKLVFADGRQLGINEGPQQ
jgi:hypothetical protein